MKYWDHPIQMTYRIEAAELTGGPAVFSYIQGPPGARGRIQFMQVGVTTAVTGTTPKVLLGLNSDTDKYLAFSIPTASAAGVVLVTDASQVEPASIPANTVLELGTDGAATEGVADIYLSIAWERK